MTTELEKLLYNGLHIQTDSCGECRDLSNELEKITESLSKSYEEVALLQRISDDMRLTQNPHDFFARLCPDIREVIEVEHVFIFWQENNEADIHKIHVMPQPAPLGQPLFDYIWNRVSEHVSRHNSILLDGPAGQTANADWPLPVRNIVSVPISRNGRFLGAIVAVNSLSKMEFDSLDTRLLTSVSNELAVFLENHYLYHDLQDLFLGSLRALSSSIDAKDPYTFGHSERVAQICRHIAGQFDLDDQQMNIVYLSGLLHDVGKIGIDEAILRKPSRLTDEEFAHIRKHSQIGADILKPIKRMEQVSHAVLCHHERYDGYGYPNRLAGKDIPLPGRIIMIADAFDVMTGERTYSKALPLQSALAEIRRCSGTQFDPELVDAFLNSDIKGLLARLQTFTPNTTPANYPEFVAPHVQCGNRILSE